jgi:cobaltochelatase CobS
MMGVTMEGDGKIACAICGERTHVIKAHLRERHPEISEGDYQARFPGAPMLSAMAVERLKEQRMKVTPTAAAAPTDDPMAIVMEEGNFLHDVFDLGGAAAARNKKTGAPIPVDTVKAGRGLGHFVPEKDPAYVFNIDLLKVCLMGLKIRKNTLLWGHAGVGKTTVWEQICAHTGRPWIRIQHTRNTEESHIIGEKTVEGGNVRFVLGPLAFAMKFGLLYCADEYDFGMPSVLSLYQPVLEGKPLVIKEADEENRVIRPHPSFRFVATGNTNGQGDETGLYQGTLLQNAANYERFGIVKEVKYQDPKVEAQIIAAQARVPKDIAEKLVGFAKMAREAFDAQRLGLPPSPRAMINAAENGRMLGDWREGVNLAYLARLNRVDQMAANEILDRIGL